MATWNNMDSSSSHIIVQNKPDTKEQILISFHLHEVPRVAKIIDRRYRTGLQRLGVGVGQGMESCF